MHHTLESLHTVLRPLSNVKGSQRMKSVKVRALHVISGLRRTTNGTTPLPSLVCSSNPFPVPHFHSRGSRGRGGAVDVLGF